MKNKIIGIIYLNNYEITTIIMSIEKKGFVPVHNKNVPHGGIPKVPPFSQKTHIYSSYTGELVGHGPIPWGTISDAPIGHKRHNLPYHGIIYDPCDDSFMIHGYRRRH